MYLLVIVQRQWGEVWLVLLGSHPLNSPLRRDSHETLMRLGFTRNLRGFLVVLPGIYESITATGTRLLRITGICWNVAGILLGVLEYY